MNSTQTTISSQTVIPLHIPTQTQSANHTVVTGTTSAITDANGKTWTITSGGQVAVDSIVDTTTANVTGLAYVNGTIWQENSSRLWWGNAAGTATSPLPATPTLTARVIGSGSDTIVLTMSEDADGPISAAGRDAEFTLNVNGQQIGGLQTVTASLSAGQTQTFRFQGNFAPGQHAVRVTFANKSMTQGDNAAFNDGGDRNIYVNSAAYDGAAVSNTVTGIYQATMSVPNATDVVPGNAVFSVNDTTSVPANAPSTPITTPAATSYPTSTRKCGRRMSVTFGWAGPARPPRGHLARAPAPARYRRQSPSPPSPPGHGQPAPGHRRGNRRNPYAVPQRFGGHREPIRREPTPSPTLAAEILISSQRPARGPTRSPAIS